MNENELIFEVGAKISVNSSSNSSFGLKRCEFEECKLLLEKEQLILQQTKAKPIQIEYSEIKSIERAEQQELTLSINNSLNIEFTTQESLFSVHSLLLALEKDNIVSPNLPELSLLILEYEFLNIELPEITKQMTREYDDNYVTPLHLAVFYNDMELVQLLVKAGAFINSDGIFGKPISIVIKNGNFKIFKYLVDNGALVDRKKLLPGSKFDAYITRNCYLRLKDIY